MIDKFHEYFNLLYFKFVKENQLLKIKLIRNYILPKDYQSLQNLSIFFLHKDIFEFQTFQDRWSES